MTVKAEDYTYRFPDHWIDHEIKEPSLFAHLHSYYVQRVIDIIKEDGAQTVLEVGCGDGWASGRMSDAGLDVLGVDWSVKGTAYASMFAPKAKFLRADIRDSAFLQQFADRFDAAALIEVIEHIPPEHCVETLRNISRCLKPGGTFVLTTPSINQPNRNRGHYRHFTEQILRDMISEAGDLDIVSIEGYGNIDHYNSHYRWARFVENRYYRVKPALKWLVNRYKQRLVASSPKVCQGFIVKMRKIRPTGR